RMSNTPVDSSCDVQAPNMEAENLAVFEFNPLQDPRWNALVETHPKASIFHTSGWLRALRQTYGYEPVAFTTSDPSEPLRNALVFAWIRSWMTGTRIVSIPFSDHCEPLFESDGSLPAVLHHLNSNSDRRGWKHAELRPLDPELVGEAGPCGFGPSGS